MFINVGNPVSTTTPPVPLLGDVVFVYSAAKAAQVKTATMYPTVQASIIAPQVTTDFIAPQVTTGVEI